jgi:hypothetical protein
MVTFGIQNAYHKWCGIMIDHMLPLSIVRWANIGNFAHNHNFFNLTFTTSKLDNYDKSMIGFLVV